MDANAMATEQFPTMPVCSRIPRVVLPDEPFAAVLASVEIPAHLWPEWFHIKDMRDYHAQLSLCRSDTHSPAQSFFSPSNR